LINICKNKLYPVRREWGKILTWSLQTFTINQNEARTSHRITAQTMHEAPNLNRDLKQNEISPFVIVGTRHWLQH